MTRNNQNGTDNSSSNSNSGNDDNNEIIAAVTVPLSQMSSVSKWSNMAYNNNGWNNISSERMNSKHVSLNRHNKRTRNIDIVDILIHLHVRHVQAPMLHVQNNLHKLCKVYKAHKVKKQQK